MSAGNVSGAITGNVTGDLTGNVTAGSGTSSFNNVTIDGTLNMNAGTTATIQNLTAPTNDLDAATKKYVDDEISTLIGDAGAGLNTLGELADALNDDDDFSTTVTNSIATKLPKAGGTMTGAIAMSTNKITGVGDPTSAQDVATKVYTDTQRDTRVATTGDTMSGALAMGSNKITGLGTPTAGTDATTKTYVDGILGSATASSASASAAATSESNAATSETNAASSASAAAADRATVASLYDSFDDRYLGPKSSAPTQDNDGNALVIGALYFNSTNNIMYVYGSGGWQAAGSSVNGTSDRQTYTATAGQTVFAATYDAGYVDVYLNGVKLLAGTDFTATNGTSVTLASGAAVNDIVDIVAYGTFVLADHLTETQSDAKYVEVAGDTMTGNLSFGDNDKAIFGAGSDLQIYHDGSNSYIHDNGVGSLKIRADQLRIESADGSETLAVFNQNSDVFLRHDNTTRLATTSTGVDITGTLTSDVIQSSSTGSASAPAYSFDSHTTAGFYRPSGLGSSIGVATSGAQRALFSNNGDISFYDDSGNAKFFWDASAESLGIGTSSAVPLDANAQLLAIHGDAVGAERAQIKLTTTTSGQAAGDGFYIAVDDSAAYISQRENQPLVFLTNATEAMRILADGSCRWTPDGTNPDMTLDASGNLLLGKTTTALADTGHNFNPSGFSFHTRSGGAVAYFNRTTSDGDIAAFYKDGAPVGSIQGLALLATSEYIAPKRLMLGWNLAHQTLCQQTTVVCLLMVGRH
jgi:hypothetical protein